MAFDGDHVTVTYDAGIDRPLRLTPDEALALVVALRMLAEMPGIDGRDAIERALAKIETAAGDLADAPVAVRMPGDAATGWPSIRRAVERRRALRITYYTATRDETTERVVDPMRVLIVDGRAYLEAWCRRAEAVRLFRVDRIDGFTELDEPAALPRQAQRQRPVATASSGPARTCRWSPCGSAGGAVDHRVLPVRVGHRHRRRALAGHDARQRPGLGPAARARPRLRRRSWSPAASWPRRYGTRPSRALAAYGVAVTQADGSRSALGRRDRGAGSGRARDRGVVRPSVAASCVAPCARAAAACDRTARPESRPAATRPSAAQRRTARSSLADAAARRPDDHAARQAGCRRRRSDRARRRAIGHRVERPAGLDAAGAQASLASRSRSRNGRSHRPVDTGPVPSGRIVRRDRPRAWSTRRERGGLAWVL